MSQKISCVPRVAAVRCQMAATFSTRALTFEPGKSGGRGREQPGIEGELAAVGGDGQGVILPRVDLLRPEPLVAVDQLLLERVLLVGHRAGDDDRLAAFQPRPGQVEHLGRLHVGEGAEHLLEFGQVGERAKRLRGRKRRAVRGDFHRVDHFAEGGRPGVEMLDAAAPQPLGVEEALHRVHLDHRVADRRAGGEGDAVAGVLLVAGSGPSCRGRRPARCRRSGCRRRAPSWSAFPGS